MKQFRDKVAIVTGGASGIGKALCELLGQYGALVHIIDRNGPGAEVVAQGISAKGGHAHAYPADVRDYDKIQAVVQSVVSEHGRIDYMFNNAGIGLAGEVRDLTLEDWREVIDINLYGVIHGITAAYSVMIRQRHGHIVNTASLNGIIAMPGTAPYAASKHGVMALSRALYIEAKQHGINVSVICPAVVDTPIFQTSRCIKVNKDDFIKAAPSTPLPAVKCAKQILGSVARGKVYIYPGMDAKVLVFMNRFFPFLTNAMASLFGKQFSRLRAEYVAAVESQPTAR